MITEKLYYPVIASGALLTRIMPNVIYPWPIISANALTALHEEGSSLDYSKFSPRTGCPVHIDERKIVLEPNLEQRQ